MYPIHRGWRNRSANLWCWARWADLFLHPRCHTVSDTSDTTSGRCAHPLGGVAHTAGLQAASAPRGASALGERWCFTASAGAEEHSPR